MKVNWKKIGLNLLYPHLVVIICLLPIAVTCLVLSLVFLGTESVLAILSYLLAFYVLLIISFRVPRIIAFFKKVKQENKYMKRYFSDVNLRMNISLYGSLVWNTAFAVFQLVLGFVYHSLWFYSMFAYYIILAVMRFYLLSYTRKFKPQEKERIENKRYLVCGWLLLLLNLALSVIIFFIVYLNKTFEYNMIVTIALAAYTFFAFTFAIINIVRYKKYKSPIYSAAKALSLISACVSMLTLETAMLTAFGDASTETFSKIILPVTGGVVSLFAITVAVMMIRFGTLRYREIINKNKEHTENLA